MTDTELRLVAALRFIQAGGESLEKISLRLGTYRQNLSAFMLGRRGAQISWIEKACNEYGFSPSWLVLGRGDMMDRQ